MWPLCVVNSRFLPGFGFFRPNAIRLYNWHKQKVSAKHFLCPAKLSYGILTNMMICLFKCTIGSLMYLLSFDLLLCLSLLDLFCCSLLHFPFCDFLESLSFVVCLLYAYFALLCLICFVLVLFCLFSFFLLFDSTLPFCLLRWLLCCVWLSFLGFDYFCTLYFLRFVLHWLP